MSGEPFLTSLGCTRIRPKVKSSTGLSLFFFFLSFFSLAFFSSSSFFFCAAVLVLLLVQPPQPGSRTVNKALTASSTKDRSQRRSVTGVQVMMRGREKRQVEAPIQSTSQPGGCHVGRACRRRYHHSTPAAAGTTTAITSIDSSE